MAKKFRVTVFDFHDDGHDEYKLIIEAIDYETAIFKAAQRLNVSDPDEIRVTELHIG